MQDNWVDFKAVKATVTMQMLLDRYQINWLRKSGEELRGRCPIHQGEGTGSFHVHLTKNAFNCFSCKARGNVLDFAAAMEKCSVRDAAMKLQAWYSVVTEVRTASVEAAERGVEEPLANKPLTFQLKGIDHAHPYLVGRGITIETAETFGVGYFGGKGSMHGRIVIPIHNEKGELVAYAGRTIDNCEPKYKLPAGFHKSLELFNLYRAIGEHNSEGCVLLVEGFFDCMKVHQAGFPAVALMGSSLSQAQEELLTTHFKSIHLLFDADDAGRQATDDCLIRLGRKVWVKATVLPDGQQADMFSPEELQKLLQK